MFGDFIIAIVFGMVIGYYIGRADTNMYHKRKKGD